ncbi:MAG: DUF2135 domain-containing protein [Dysgonamonadaceae bacterium]|jgi:hypothetical protein|nr:DUF2135 domain-containing protein [Dysgonamonadaceae bacterium]
MKKVIIVLAVVLSIAMLSISILVAQIGKNPIENPVIRKPNLDLSELPLPVMRVSEKTDSGSVYLQSLDIQVEITGNIAATQYTMIFKNSSARILEGELLFPLPEGLTVSRYALDINGKMREAVPVEKAKATQVFEEIEQQNVDPGLLERVEGNNFRTRIYPLPANGTRTITIGYEEELPVEQSRFQYRLPMAYKTAIENFSLKATVWKSSEKPQVDAAPNELQFDRQGENFVASFVRKNYQPERILAFSLPAPAEIPQTWVQSASGSYYFTASCVPEAKVRKKQWSNQLGIIWDVSLSGLQRDIKKELDVLNAIFRENKNLTVSLYFLNNQMIKKGVYKIANGNWNDLQKDLESAVYDGGTNYDAIHLKNISSEEFLFFSDGISTLSDAGFAASNEWKKHPIHCVVSSAKANYSAMKWIAAQTKGKFINLNRLSPENLQNELMFETLQFLGYESDNSVREVYPSIAAPVYGQFSIAGILDRNTAKITLLFGYGNKIEKRISLSINAKEAQSNGLIHRIWAQKKINELDMRYEQNKAELTELGQQFGIVTRNTSLIVLETLQDYITYNITPPAELQAEFFRWRKGQDDQRTQEEKSLMNKALASAEELQAWWETGFNPEKPKYTVPDTMLRQEEFLVENSGFGGGDDVLEEVIVTSIVGSEERVNFTPPVLSSVAVEESENINIADMAEHSSELFEVVATTAHERKNLTLTKSSTQAVIRIVPVKEDNEYTKQLTGKADVDYQQYLKLRNEYLNTPNFYFYMADWFFRLGDRKKALCILTSIAEIDLENASLYRLLGYRLKEYKEYALEAYICKKVIQWRPMEPQSYRDYALSLADNRLYQSALDSLYSVLKQSYAQNINRRSFGIEEVVVTEINNLIAQNKSLKTSQINKKIIQATPVDIRVVINWNMNNTDIDLHVKDPRGEVCFYSHSSTALGGRISHDITEGYGPEQFMLKKAITGKYEVFVNYFGDSQVKTEGPSTIMAEIYTHYSSQQEQRQVVCLQLSKETKQKDGLVKVAEFEF